MQHLNFLQKNSKEFKSLFPFDFFFFYYEIHTQKTAVKNKKTRSQDQEIIVRGTTEK
jgi:hypothetical protein